jgi:hypothetical protein
LTLLPSVFTLKLTPYKFGLGPSADGASGFGGE